MAAIITDAVRRIIALILALLAWGAGEAAVAPGARADGDPASDVLTFTSLFVPPDAGSSRSAQAGLAAAVGAANRAGYPLRVALIGSGEDLGTVTELMGQPSRYAYYLSRELSLGFHGATLVVMPQGFGLYPPLDPHAVPHRDVAALGSLTAPGSALAGPAARLVELLADASGHPIGDAAAGGRIVGAAPDATTPSSSALPVIVTLVGGALLVAGAWTVSLRRRPLGSKVVA